jgi:hypothetical protein
MVFFGERKKNDGFVLKRKKLEKKKRKKKRKKRKKRKQKKRKNVTDSFKKTVSKFI